MPGVQGSAQVAGAVILVWSLMLPAGGSSLLAFGVFCAVFAWAWKKTS
jgi:hypothetical protein